MVGVKRLFSATTQTNVVEMHKEEDKLMIMDFKKQFMRKHAKSFNSIAWNQRLVREWEPRVLKSKQLISNAAGTLIREIMKETNFDIQDIIDDELL